MRENFLEEISHINPEKVVFLDEFGFDTHQKYSYAWGLRGKRVYADKHGGKGERVNTIACLNYQRKLFASFVFHGSCDKDVFDIYVKDILLPSLKAGTTVIMDNASFHKSSNVEGILLEKNCKVLYLPPYSPDLNPIEESWSPLKNDLKKRFLEAIKHPLETVMEVVRSRSI